MIDGDVERVRKALLEISDSLVSSPSAKRTLKKPRFDSSSDQAKCSHAPSVENNDVDMSSESTKKDLGTHDPVSEPVSTSEQDLGSVIVGTGLTTLYECTSHNCNILHICCQGCAPKQRKDPKYASKKAYHPFRG